MCSTIILCESVNLNKNKILLNTFYTPENLLLGTVGYKPAIKLNKLDEYGRVL